MTISDTYDIISIVDNLEVALCISGEDYAEKNIDNILDKIYNRFIKHYNLDLRNRLISDAYFYIDKDRSKATLFVENMSLFHARLCGYLQIVRFTKEVRIKPININFMGFSQNSFNDFLFTAIDIKGMLKIRPVIYALRNKFGTVNSCIEKRLLLILIIAYEIGLYEIVASISEIFYLGLKLT